MPEGGLEPPT